MPRKQPPLEKWTQFDWKDAETYRPDIIKIVQQHLGRECTNLSEAKFRQMIDYLIYSVGVVKAGLPSYCVQGSRAKKASAELDIITRDTNDALAEAGVRHITTDTQELVRAIAQVIGSRGHGGRIPSLDEQVRRAKHIEKTKWPDVTIEITLPDQDVRVTIGGTSSPN